MSTRQSLLLVSGMAAASGLAGFLYIMAHPSSVEPAWVFKIRSHPSATGEYLALLAHGVFHPHLLRSGATREEKSGPLPGDELVPGPWATLTRAITIDAPRSAVWPWLVQMGGGRAGWYWWVPLTCYPQYAHEMTGSPVILPQFQHLELGDALSDGGPYVTEQRGNWMVREIMPERHLVLYAGRRVMEGDDFMPDEEQAEGIWFASSWAFVLQPAGRNKTRFLVRVRAVGGPAWVRVPLLLVFGGGDTVAHSTMLRGIKERAEREYRKAPTSRSSAPAPEPVLRR